MNTGTLKGVNFGGWFSQIDAIQEKDPENFCGIDEHIKTFISKTDIVRIKNAGFNHIRLPIDYQNIFSEDGEIIHDDRLARFEKAVNDIIDVGLIVLLDLHECPGHDFDKALQSAQDFFTDPGKRKASKKIWMHFCRMFRNNQSIYLEILNEPVAPNSHVWNEIKKEMAEFVRDQAPENTIVIGSNYWNSPSAFKDLTPLNDTNILYCFHFYSPLLFTHQNASWLNDPNVRITRNYPGDYTIKMDTIRDYRLIPETGLWNKARLAKEIEAVLRFRDIYKLPVICDEFGVFHQAPRDSQLQWISDFLSILNEHDIGFSYWNYKNLDFGLVTSGEKLHENLPQFANADHLDKELMNLLACG